MKYCKRTCIIVLSIYLLYAVKTAAGIDISLRYHAIDVVKVPTNFMIDQLNGVIRFLRQA
jgi:hypothetical protein